MLTLINLILIMIMLKSVILIWDCCSTWKMKRVTKAPFHRHFFPFSCNLHIIFRSNFQCSKTTFFLGPFGRSSSTCKNYGSVWYKSIDDRKIISWKKRWAIWWDVLWIFFSCSCLEIWIPWKNRASNKSHQITSRFLTSHITWQCFESFCNLFF